MFKEIIDGISLKLNQVFGDGYEVYGDTNIVQGLKEPCFFITLLNPTHTRIVGKRYFKNNPFMIQYFPKNAEDNIELHNVASELFEALEYITLTNKDILHGTSMEYEIADGVLNFKVNYNAYLLKKEEPIDAMEELEVNANKI